MKIEWNSSSIEVNEGQDSLWLTCYADLISAILAVLVLLASFSKIDVEAFDAVQRARNDQEFESLSQIYERIEKIARENQLTHMIDLKLSKNGLEINFNSVMLFDKGSARLDSDQIEKVRPVLEVISSVGSKRQIDVIGHTDDIPFNSASGRTNWDLSADRAAQLHHYLLDQGMPTAGSRLIAYADTQPLVATDNLKEPELELARQKNRRVSVLIGLVK